MSDWYVTRGEQERGPLTWEQVRKFAATGKLRRDDLLREGFGFGRPAGEYADLPFFDPDAAAAPKPTVSALRQARSDEKRIRPGSPPPLGPISIPVFLMGSVFLGVALACWAYWMESHPPQLVDLPGARPAVAPPAAGPAPLPPPTLVMPSDEEARDFGDKVVQSFLTGEPKETDLIDFDAIGDRVVQGLSVPPRFRTGLVKGMQDSGLFARLRKNLGEDSSMRVLRIRDVGNEKQVLIRALGEGVNYLEFILSKAPGGQVRAADVFVYVSGERFTETMRAVTIPIAAQANRSLLERLQGKEYSLVANLPKFDEINKALRAGDHAKALEVYAQLPRDVQEMKVVQLLRYQAAIASLEGAEFVAMIDDMRTILGNDPRLELMFLDQYVITKQFDRTLAATTQIYRDTGDPYMRVLRADVYAEQGKPKMAIREAQEAIREEPELTLAWLTLLHYQIAEEEFDDALATLKKMLPLFGREYGWDALFALEEYAGFRDTPQHEAWKTFLEGEAKSPCSPDE